MAILKAMVVCGVLANVSSLLPPASEASPVAKGFVCSVANGAPSTSAVKADGAQVPVIRWTSSAFEAAGWSPERRCEAVSKRFDSFYRQGRLTYITTGRMNSLPVICTAQTNGGPCDGLLYTLKPGQNATATLKSLLEIRVKARGPLNETTERMYVSLNELLSTAEARATGTGSSFRTSPASRPSSNPLW